MGLVILNYTMTQLETLQQELQKLIRIGRGLSSNRKEIFHITPERLQYFFDTYFNLPLDDWDYYVSYDPSDHDELLLLMRFHLHLYVHDNVDENKIYIPPYFPRVFQIEKEVNKTNHPHVPETFEVETKLFYVNDHYGTNNWLLGIPLSKNFEPLEGTNLIPTTQINYDYIFPTFGYGDYFPTLSAGQKSDKNFMLSTLQDHILGWNDENLNLFTQALREYFSRDRSFYEEAVKIKTYGYWVLQSADESIGIDEEMVLEAIKNRQIYSLDRLVNYGVSRELVESPEFVKKALELNSDLVMWLSEEWRNNKEIMLEVINRIPFYYCYASDELKNDAEIRAAAFSDKNKFLAAQREEDVDEIGVDFLSWPEDWQTDRELLLACSLEFWNWEDDASQLYRKIIGENFSKDADFFREALQKYGEDGSIFNFSDESLRRDQDLLFLCLKAGYELYPHMQCTLESIAPPEFLNEYDFMRKIISHFPNCLSCAGENIKDDTEIVRSAIVKEGNLLEYASNRLRANEEMVLLAIKQNPESKMFADPQLVERLGL
ncbi:DUF4116 domain-containing protein [Namhaeicola litoreus]|uniref:DUF4116 domain-containing protein n=1 Tax=Namhaeicola litoreus TaxID=1052145 RepID=A0ABW3XZE4_9FLAO